MWNTPSCACVLGNPQLIIIAVVVTGITTDGKDFLETLFDPSLKTIP